MSTNSGKLTFINSIILGGNSSDTNESRKDKTKYLNALATILQSLQDEAKFYPQKQNSAEATTHYNKYVKSITNSLYLPTDYAWQLPDSSLDKLDYTQFIDKLIEVSKLQPDSRDENIIQQSLGEMANTFLIEQLLNQDLRSKSKIANFNFFVIDARDVNNGVENAKIKLIIHSVDINFSVNNRIIIKNFQDFKVTQLHLNSTLVNINSDELSKMPATTIEHWIRANISHRIDVSYKNNNYWTYESSR